MTSLQLYSKLAKPRFSMILIWVVKYFRNFAHSTIISTVRRLILSCSGQNFKEIWQLRNKVISKRDFVQYECRMSFRGKSLIVSAPLVGYIYCYYRLNFSWNSENMQLHYNLQCNILFSSSSSSYQAHSNVTPKSFTKSTDFSWVLWFDPTQIVMLVCNKNWQDWNSTFLILTTTTKYYQHKGNYI